MDEERGAAIDSGAQHAQAFVGCVPGFDDDVVEFVAQEIFDHALVAWFDFEEVGEHAYRREAGLHHAGLEQAADGFGGVSVLGDDGFERAFLAERGGVLGAENVEIGFGAGFFQLLLLDQAAELADLFGDAADALGDGFKFEGELAALSAEGFDLNAGVGDLGFEAAGFAVGSGEAFFGLRELVAQARRGGNGVEDGDARFFLLALDFGEAGGGSGGVLLAESEIALRGGEIGGGGFENLAVRFAFGFERGQAMAGLRQLGFVRCGAYQQFGATLFVVAAAGVGAVDFEGDLADAVAVLAQFGFDGVAALGAFGVLGLELLHGFGAVLHFLGEGVELSVDFGAFLIRWRRTCWPALRAAWRAFLRAGGRSVRLSRPGASANSSGA